MPKILAQSINDIEHKKRSAIVLNDIKLSVVILNDTMLNDIMLNDIMLNGIMLNDIMLNDNTLSVVILNVVTLSAMAGKQSSSSGHAPAVHVCSLHVYRRLHSSLFESLCSQFHFWPKSWTHHPGNTKRGSITVLLISCLTGLKSAV